MNELLDKLQEQYYKNRSIMLVGSTRKVFQMVYLLNTMRQEVPDCYWKIYGKLNRN